MAITDSFLYFITPFLSCQVSVIQYGVNPKFEFKLSQYKTKDEVIAAASRITQMSGVETNTFRAIQYARLVLVCLLCIFCIHMYVCVCVCVYIYIYLYIYMFDCLIGFLFADFELCSIYLFSVYQFYDYLIKTE